MRHDSFGLLNNATVTARQRLAALWNVLANCAAELEFAQL